MIDTVTTARLHILDQATRSYRRRQLEALGDGDADLAEFWAEQINKTLFERLVITTGNEAQRART